MRRWLRSLFITPLIFLVALYTLLEEFLENVVKPVIEYISRWHILRMAERFLQKRHPYTLFIIYIGKLVLFSSIKLLSLYWISQGRGYGAPLLVTGELCGAAFTVWYVKVALPPLLTLRWFAVGYGKLMAIKNWLIHKLQRMPVYQYAKHKVQWCRQKLRNLKAYIRHKITAGARGGRGISTVKAVYRFVSRKR